MESSSQSSDAAGTAAEDNLLIKSQSLPSNGSRPLEHPLLNPLIVNLIVKHLEPDFDQLKTLRLVSKVWTQATHHLWRNSCAVLTLIPNPPNFSRSTSCETTGVSVSNFMNEFHNPQSFLQLSQKPFSKYKLKNFTLDLELCASREPGGLAFQFWNEIGPLMESVHFYRCLFERPEDSSDSNAICPRVQFLARMIPSLKDLVLTDMTTPEAEDYWGDEFAKVDEIPSDFFGELENLQGDCQGGPQHLNLRTLTIYGDLKRNMSFSQLLMMAPGLEVIKGGDQFMRALLKPINKVRYYSTSNSVMPSPPLSNLKNIDMFDSMALNSGHFPWDSPKSLNPLDGFTVGSQVPLETLSLQLGSFGESGATLDIYLPGVTGQHIENF